jgi:flagellar biogenesis protein FliO
VNNLTRHLRSVLVLATFAVVAPAMAQSTSAVEPSAAPNAPAAITQAAFPQSTPAPAPAVIPPVAPAAAPAAQTPAPVADASVMNSEIRRPQAVEGGAKPSSSSSDALYGFARVAGSLGLVLAAIIGLKVFAGRMLGIKSAGPKSNRGVRVLSRTTIGAKQQLMLLQVGRRLVLVADSGGQMNSVCEITDPDEVAELAAQALGEAPNMPGFNRVLRGRASEFIDDEFEGDEISDPTESRGELEGSRELAGLSDRIKALGKQFSPS